MSKAQSLKGRSILLGVTGSIAVYKACELVRLLKEQGAAVYCLMTRGALRFVSALTFGALSGNAVATDVWDEKLWKMAHLEFAEQADLYIIAPASTHVLARLACGMADDVVCATAVAMTAPLLIAPAMHEGMWLHPATKENVKKLKSYGAHFVGPEQGELLRGNIGWGRLAEPETILAAAKKILKK